MKASLLHKKVVVCFTILSFILVLSPIHAAPQIKTGNMMGFIYKEDGKTPKKDAQVILRDIKDQKIEFKSNITDKNGDYKINDIPIGDYKIFIKLHDRDYKIRRVDFFVKVTENMTSFISFSLKKDKLLAIIIVGTAVTAAAALLLGIPALEEEQSPTTR